MTFTATNLTNRRQLFKKEVEINLEPFMIGLFEKDATRDEIQEIAFKATEEKIYPYVGRWVDLAGLQAMGQEGTAGKSFEPFLEELLAEEWTSDDMRGETKRTLTKIRGES